MTWRGCWRLSPCAARICSTSATWPTISVPRPHRAVRGRSSPSPIGGAQPLDDAGEPAEHFPIAPGFRAKLPHFRLPCFTVGACLGAVGARFFPEPGVLGLKGGAVGARLRANVAGNGNKEHGERDSDTDHGERVTVAYVDTSALVAIAFGEPPTAWKSNS